jgi:5-methyltetrahydropteroyltriglutamate--homocysteine methyltransferase
LSDLVGTLFPATFAGSYPRPTWFNHNLAGRDVLQALRDESFAEAYKDGILAMINDQERAGLDVLADGHLWYDSHQGFIASFVLYNAERLKGVSITPTSRFITPRIDLERRQTTFESGEVNPFEESEQLQTYDEGMAGVILTQEVVFSGEMEIVDRLERGPMRHAVNWSLAQQCTSKPVQAQFADGPIGQSMILANRHYRDRKALLRDLAQIYRAEIQDAVAAGAKIIQLDDLMFLAPKDEWELDVEIMNTIFDGIDAYKIWHCCHGGTGSPIGIAPYVEMFPIVKEMQVDAFDWSFAQTGFPDDVLELFATPGFDKDLGLGVISNKNYLIETPTEIAAAIRKALQYVEPERLYLTSDCGLFAYARVAAFGKLRSMVEGAAIVRREYARKEVAR